MMGEPSQISDGAKLVLGALAYFASQFCFSAWQVWKTNKKTTEKAEELDLNTPSPDDVRDVKKEVITLRAQVKAIQTDLETYRGQAVNLAHKYTEATTVLSKEFNAQRFALNKALEPGPNVDVTVLDEPTQPIGKIILKP